MKMQPDGNSETMTISSVLHSPTSVLPLNYCGATFTPGYHFVVHLLMPLHTLYKTSGFLLEVRSAFQSDAVVDEAVWDRWERAHDAWCATRGVKKFDAK